MAVLMMCQEKEKKKCTRNFFKSLHLTDYAGPRDPRHLSKTFPFFMQKIRRSAKKKIKTQTNKQKLSDHFGCNELWKPLMLGIGTTSCFSCRAFFRRTIQKVIQPNNWFNSFREKKTNLQNGFDSPYIWMPSMMLQHS